MKNKINRKYLYDIIMTIIMLLLMDYTITGLALHEWLGLALFILFAAHKLLNYRWIKNITTHLFDEKIKPRIKVMYVLDVLLLIFVISVTASGILISDKIFSFSLQNRSLWVNIHDISAYGSLIVISVHIGLHWKNIMNAVKKIFHVTKPNVIRTVFIRGIALVLILAGIKSSFDKNIGEKFLSLTDSVNNLADDTPLINSKNSAASQTESTLTTVSASKEVPTLNEYLGSLHCTLCSKHCSLLSPQCSKGAAVAAQAEVTYQTLYQTENDTTEDTEQTDKTASADLADSKNTDSVLDIFADYLPVMGLYIGATYYIIEWTGRKRN